MKRKSIITILTTVIIIGTSIISYANNSRTGLQLKVVPKPAENMVRLDWSGDTREKTFKVFQKKPGSTEFQTIGATDFDKNKQVKVLNLHPNIGSSISFTTWDGETMTLPISASLKKWMEEPNSENPKGYGKGIIEVTPVDISLFNESPDTYLKGSDGSFKYDVVMIGSYDSNGSKDLSEKGLTALDKMISEGRGLLLGHDTVCFTNLGLIAKKHADIEVVAGSVFGVGDTKIKIIRNGLLTNYPWGIEGVLTIPRTHTTRQLAPKNDIWMEFVDVTDGKVTAESVSSTWPEILKETDTHSNNFYLSSKNNTSVIQTGHSNGNATPDEQKLLANTLFYLNQLSTDTFLDDRSGQDLSAPNKPIIDEHTISKGKVSFRPTRGVDNGSEYQYYVEAEGKDGGKLTSNTASTTITTGFKGYSYVIDNKTDTEPDNSVDIGQDTIHGDVQGVTTYLHIKAIDNVGNASETLHYKIEDKEKPLLTVTGNPTEWTNTDILLNVDATDKLSGVKEIILPDGSKTTNLSTVYKVNQNATLKFEAIDYSGNKETVSINVNKIDKTNPVLSASKEINPNKKEGFININISDSNSGIKELILPNGNVIKNISSYKYPINANGNYLFTGVDNTNNKTIITVNVSELQIGNSSGISKIEYKLHGATVKDWTVYNEPFYISNEGITYITARSYDRAGNVSSEVTSEAKIDKTKPKNNSIKIELIK